VAIPAATPPKPGMSAADYHQEGRKFIQEEHFAQAIAPLTQAIKLEPTLATVFNARGYAYYRLKKYKESMADFDQAIKLNPLYANAYTNRSSARRAAGDKTGADADQAKVRELMTKAPTK
jgi:Flp pilus assembly protein TadD